MWPPHLLSTRRSPAPVWATHLESAARCVCLLGPCADAGSLVNYVSDQAAATRLTDRFTQQVTKLWLLDGLPRYVPAAGAAEPEPESQPADDGLSVHIERTCVPPPARRVAICTASLIDCSADVGFSQADALAAPRDAAPQRRQ